MKNIIAIIFIAGALLSSCKKAEELKYSSADNIFFNFNDATSKDRDSVIFTFAYNPTKTKDTVFIPLSISGVRKSYARKFKVEVVTTGTTAEVGKHYEALKPEYIMPADSGRLRLPIIVFNTDLTLAQRSVILNFRLVSTEDLHVDIIKMTTGKLLLSNKLEKPSWWGPGSGTWGIPNYSQTKHELWLLSTGIINLPFNGLNAPQYLYYIGLLTNLLNDPAAWIKANPERGYILELRSDGDYNFYNPANPNKKTLFKKNTTTGKFFFIDETGKEVV